MRETTPTASPRGRLGAVAVAVLVAVPQVWAPLAASACTARPAAGSLPQPGSSTSISITAMETGSLAPAGVTAGAPAVPAPASAPEAPVPAPVSPAPVAVPASVGSTPDCAAQAAADTVSTPATFAAPAPSSSAAADGATDTEEGAASWYGPGFDGLRTASGEIFRTAARTVAHPTLPFGSLVRIENLTSGRTTIARVNDRGPYVPGRIIDCSYAVARALGFIGSGVAQVRVTALDSIAPASCFAAPANAGRLPFEDSAPPFRTAIAATPACEVAFVEAPPAAVAFGSPGTEWGATTMREASVVPFPALMQASRCAAAWFSDHRARLHPGARLRLQRVGLRSLIQLFAL